MRRVFALASGVYALGATIRLLRRRSGAPSARPTPVGVARPTPARPTSPGRTPARGEDEADTQNLGEPSAPEAPGEDARDLRVPDVVDPTDAEAASTPAPVILPARSELDGLSRERLFEIAQATGHRLENLITMSRDDLINAVARPADAPAERPVAPPLRRTHPPRVGPSRGQDPNDPDVNEQAG